MVLSERVKIFWEEFLEGSTIHGLRYLVQSKIRYQRIFWLLLLLVVSGLFAVLVYRLTIKHRSDQVIIRNSNKQFNVTEIYHPALTICSELKSFGSNITEEKRFYDILDDMNLEFNASSFLVELKQRTQIEWFTYCVFGAYGFKFLMSLSPVLTKHGICLNFNMQPAKSMFNLDKVSTDFHYEDTVNLNPWIRVHVNQEEHPWRPFIDKISVYLDFRRKSCGKLHKQGGMDTLSEPDPFVTLHDESSTFRPVDGILAIVHSSDEYPLNNGRNLFVEYWSENELMVYPEMFKIDNELKTWPLEKRNCYLVGEKKLTFFKIYNQQNCEHECLSLLTLEKCGCVPFYMIRSPTAVLCGVHDKMCVRDTADSFHADQEDLKSACKCLSLCEYVEYRVNEKTIPRAIGLSTTTLKTKFPEKFFIPKIQQNAFGSADYLGSIGGLMGLVAGMSIISLVEVGFFIIRVVVAKLVKVRNSQVSSIEINIISPNKKTVISRCSTFLFTFIDKSDIHGVHRMVEKNKSIGEKIFWLITVLASSAACFVLIFDLIKSSEMNPIEYSIDQNVWDIKEIPFPQITFCPGEDMKKFSQHKACVESNICDGIDAERVRILRDPIKGPEELKPFMILNYMTEDMNNDAKMFAETGSYVKVGPDVLTKFRPFSIPQKFENQSFCISDLREVKLKEVLNNDKTCFTFNYFENLMNFRELGKDYTEAKVYKTVCNDQNALTKLKTLSINIKDDEKLCCKGGYIGFAVHNLDQGLKDADSYIMPNSKTKVILRPKITTTDESLRTYSPRTRNCYFSDEKKLKFFTKYSQSYCLLELKSLFMQKTCGCVHFLYLRNDSQRVCGNHDFACSGNINFKLEQSDDFKNNDCLPECNSIDYSYEVISERMKPEINSTNEEVIYEASIYFDGDEFVAYKRYESYGTVSLLSNIGGLLGLFLGLSVLSVIETIYFFTLRLLNNLWCKIN